MISTNESDQGTVETSGKTKAEQVTWLNVSERAGKELKQHFNAVGTSQKLPGIVFRGYV